MRREWARLLDIKDLKAPGRISSGYATDAERRMAEMGKEVPGGSGHGVTGGAATDWLFAGWGLGGGCGLGGADRGFWVE